MEEKKEIFVEITDHWGINVKKINAVKDSVHYHTVILLFILSFGFFASIISELTMAENIQSFLKSIKNQINIIMINGISANMQVFLITVIPGHCNTCYCFGTVILVIDVNIVY